MNLFAKSVCGQQDTFICDNGGFEQNFTFYKGLHGEFTEGSSSCNPTFGNSQVTWLNSILPSSRRFEIVTSGIDQLIGIPKTKFGSKALQINSKYGVYTGGECYTSNEIERVIKKFRVTNSNLDFTIWYALAVENPANHINTQPYLSIKCDLAPEYDLCFDAAVLHCPKIYPDENCQFDSIDVIPWTCHRFKIDRAKIGQIATLEITVADCAQGQHFGYAYVDGICEECNGGALGSGLVYDQNFNLSTGVGIKTNPCVGDTLTVCGNYSLPTICGIWKLDSIKAFGYKLRGFELDTVNHVFCIDVPKSLFTGINCRDIYFELFFSSIFGKLPPVITNSIEICPSDFIKYEFTVNTGPCHNNASPFFMSDDFYNVTVAIANASGKSWTMERVLDDPLPNESGSYIIKTGSGNGNINLGPIFIQEGGWTLRIFIDDCVFTYHIMPPDFCSGCLSLRRTVISNISCNNNGTNDPSDDTWTFDLIVYGPQGQTYFIGQNTQVNYNFNQTYNINAGLISQNCYELLIKQSLSCFASFLICPPKPCSNNLSCQLEVYVKDINCNENNTNYSVDLTVSGANFLCYRSIANGGPISDNQQGSLPNGPVGPFVGNVTLIVYSCTVPACACPSPSCFKVMYISKPDCPDLDFGNSNPRSILETNDDVIILPNPFLGNSFTLISKITNLNFEIYNSSGQLIQANTISKPESIVELNGSSGIYFLKYEDKNSQIKFIKFIKN